MVEKKMIGGIEHEWSEQAADYAAGFDPVLKLHNGEQRIYTPEEVPGLQKDVRHCLVRRPRKIGCWVKTLAGTKKMLERKKI